MVACALLHSYVCVGGNVREVTGEEQGMKKLRDFVGFRTMGDYYAYYNIPREVEQDEEETEDSLVLQGEEDREDDEARTDSSVGRCGRATSHGAQESHGESRPDDTHKQ